MKRLTGQNGTEIFMIAGGRSNVFLILSGNKKILVDTGPAFMRQVLIRRLKKLNIRHIDYLILTHTHFDHAANAWAIKQYFHSKVIVHASEELFLKTGDSPVPSGSNLFTKWLTVNFGTLANRLVKYRGCDADIIVNEQLTFTGVDAEIRILHTPGHSSGSLCVIIHNKTVLAGDTIFGTYPGSCFPPFADNQVQLLRSWELLLASGCEVFYPSHGSSRTREQILNGLRKKSTTGSR